MQFCVMLHNVCGAEGWQRDPQCRQRPSHSTTSSTALPFFALCTVTLIYRVAALIFWVGFRDTWYFSCSTVRFAVNVLLITSSFVKPLGKYYCISIKSMLNIMFLPCTQSDTNCINYCELVSIRWYFTLVNCCLRPKKTQFFLFGLSIVTNHQRVHTYSIIIPV